MKKVTTTQNVEEEWIDEKMCECTSSNFSMHIITLTNERIRPYFSLTFTFLFQQRDKQTSVQNWYRFSSHHQIGIIYVLDFKFEFVAISPTEVLLMDLLSFLFKKKLYFNIELWINLERIFYT